ncbi:hypothetical protein SCOR_16360 [Sulfidibacter corallicola]|uniref:Uncharacterized protein n=1 Tax=Sulfidibacter corallicola TaxID=2818388 RepID=A0A8A4TVI9_SULCO|nr:hypothetical protein [Sulfidibacter corallicola]QTD53966.1 hypothetical protein J3U87_16070 [Sulfidibacter corallicola]
MIAWMLLLVLMPMEDLPQASDESEQVEPVEILLEAASLESGLELFRQGKYFEAESQFLGVQPTDENRATLAIHLAAIAMRMNAVEGKREFYKSSLSRGLEWRGVSQLVLVLLAAQLEDWVAFKSHAQQYLEEIDDFGGPLRWKLIYGLARYTDIGEEPLKLPPTLARWFRLARQLPPEAIFPTVANLDIPFILRFAHHLETGSDFNLPPLPSIPSEEDIFFHRTLSIKQALNRGDLNEAARRINEAMPQSKQIEDVETRLYFQDVLKTYYAARDQQRAIQIVSRNRATLAKRAVFPFESRPAAVNAANALRKAAAERPAKPPVEDSTATVEKPKPEETDTASPEPKIDRTPKPPKVTVEKITYRSLERQIRRRQWQAEETVRSKTPDTRYKEIYRDYLLGLVNLEKGRLTEAEVLLSKARKAVTELPFPNLECKILIGLARYHTLRGEGNRANWFFLRAVEIWKIPENLPMLSMGREQVQEKPFGWLIDRELVKTSSSQVIDDLFLFNELDHLVTLRQLALEREALSDNPVLGHQLTQVGGQLIQLTEDLAENPNHQASPRRYNQTLDIWSQLWEQTRPFYRETKVPPLAEIQRVLNRRDRVLVFLEGERNLGILVLGKEQAFSVNLGSKSDFLDMSGTRQLDFLEGRLGPVWNHHGPLYVMLSAHLKRDEFIQRLRTRMENPSQLIILFSLKSLVAPKRQSECRRYALLNAEDSSEASALAGSMPSEDLSLVNGEDANSRFVLDRLDRPDRVFYVGPVKLDKSGLFLSADNSGIATHQLIHVNNSLCSLVLVSRDFTEWGNALDELELISPSGEVAIFLFNRIPESDKRVWQHRRFGVHLR